MSRIRRRGLRLASPLIAGVLGLAACATGPIEETGGADTLRAAPRDTVLAIADALEVGALDLAARRVDRARLAGYRDPELDYLTGKLLFARGEPGAAAALLARVPADSPAGLQAALLRVRALAAIGACDAALDLLAAYPDHEAGDWRLSSVRGVCEARAGAFDAAILAHRVALDLVRDRGGDAALVLTNLGYASLLSGDRAAARQSFAEARASLEAAERGPRDPVARKLAGNLELLAASEAASAANLPSGREPDSTSLEDRL